MIEFKEQNKSFPSGHQLKRERPVVTVVATPQVDGDGPLKHEQVGEFFILGVRRFYLFGFAYLTMLVLTYRPWFYIRAVCKLNRRES